jgi:hypothetical protein
MIAAIAITLLVVLGGIALLHGYWALGGFWPGHNEAELIAKVAGAAGAKRMPSAAITWTVAAAIAITAVVPLALSGLVAAPAAHGLVAAIGAMIFLVFLGRGIAGYLPAWRRRFPREPFASRDVRYFSPLCLLVAAGYGLLLLNGGRG